MIAMADMVVRKWMAVGLLFLALVGPTHAVQPDEMLPDPALETRARMLSRELRCMVCQNQSIDDSDAPLARDLRILVRERLTAGDSDRQVLDFLTARYGEFVLLKPLLAWHTALLWLAPPGILMLATLMLITGLRRRRRAASSDDPFGALANSTLTATEEARLATILEERREA
jgi:cytochrome c-type biogenesis protein CcmH